MSRDHDGYAGVVLMAFVMGAITGVAVGLLWTPTTGEERRRFLNERAREGREKVSVAAQRGREFVQQQREHLSTGVARPISATAKATTTPPRSKVLVWANLSGPRTRQAPQNQARAKSEGTWSRAAVAGRQDL